jgi:putative heme-binding domain-containing protein
VQFLASSNGMLRVSLNGRPAYQRADGPYRSDSDRFDADLEAGLTRVKIEVSARRPAQFHARFRLRSAKADHERLMQAALTGGNADRGREVFQNPQKPGCVKCHRIGPEGARIGPDLTGVGRRFSRVHLIESILEPSRTILPAFQNWAVKLKDGRILSGVKVLETEAELSLGDTDGKTHVFPKSSVEQQKELALSLMPEGLERGLTDREFVDLVAYLSSLR